MVGRRVSLANKRACAAPLGSKDGKSCHVEGAGERWRGYAVWITALPKPAGLLSLYNTQPNRLHYRPFHYPLLFFSSSSSVPYRVGDPCSWLTYAPSPTPPPLYAALCFIPASLFSNNLSHIFTQVSIFSPSSSSLYRLNFFSFESF